MTDVKELIEKIIANPLAITDEIDWANETDDFSEGRLRELIYNIPHELYKPLRDTIIAVYRRLRKSGPMCVNADNFIIDNKYEMICNWYGADPLIDNFFFHTYEERLQIDRNTEEYEEAIRDIRNNLPGIGKLEDSEDTNSTIRKLNTEVLRLKNEYEKLEEEKREVEEMAYTKSFDFNFALLEDGWTEICYAMSNYACNMKTESGKNYSNAQIAKALNMLTGYSHNKLRYRKEEKTKHKEDAKKFLIDLANKIK